MHAKLVHDRFLCRKESWGHLLQDTRHDRLWALSDDQWRCFLSEDQTLAPFSDTPYRHQGSFALGALGCGLSAPVSVSWSITSSCNSHCQFCCTDSINNYQMTGEASISEVESTLDTLLEWGVTRIIIGGGEPLVRPDICQILEVFRSHSFKPALATNGLLLKGKLLQKVATSCMTVQISLDTLNRDKYYNLRGVDGLPLVLHNIQTAAKTAPLVRVATVLTSANRNELLDIGCFLARLGISQWFVFELLNAGRARNCYDSLHIRGEVEARHILDEIERRFPQMSTWYWGSRLADGCAVYITPDGRLALADYHTDVTRFLNTGQLDLTNVKSAWDQVPEEAKRSMLENFLSSNRLKGSQDDVFT